MEKIKISIETTSPTILKEKEINLIKYIEENKIDYEIKHDGVGFGSEQDFTLIIGIVIYITESSLSGATWDFIKSTIESFYRKINESQRELTTVEAEYFKNGNVKRIHIASYEDKNIIIKNKNGEEILRITKDGND